MAYDNTTAYIDRDKYLDFAGVNLDIELKNSNYDNPTRKVEIFISNVQKWLYNYMCTRFDNKFYEDTTSDYWDDDTFTKALLWQVKHILKYGEDEQLDKTAYRILRSHGMANPKNIGG